MTRNQLTYQSNLEIARHNRRAEGEDRRANVARENENERHNRRAETYEEMRAQAAQSQAESAARRVPFQNAADVGKMISGVTSLTNLAKLA